MKGLDPAHEGLLDLVVRRGGRCGFRRCLDWGAPGGTRSLCRT